ncbi:LAMI_0H07118g1_1 [Lachancea mirantina]|uniref:LAMI_0H07118g1_1 n=1 Tax=Lachancea mirantina TaxID=1230905 RepID=A0A1G4KFG3_9SACH|nr:LAMI_0H07118g1_1 [Lachancea mirantina]
MEDSTRRGGRYCKIAVLGARNVGKTSLTVQFVESHFVESYYPTTENQFSKQLRVGKLNYSLEICDTAGQDDVSVLNNKSLNGIQGIMIVYSCVNRASFDVVSVIRDKVNDQLEFRDIATLVVANKIDLRDAKSGGWSGGNERVTEQEGRRLAERLGAGFVECSAKYDTGVDKAFEKMVRRVEALAPAGVDDGCSVM